MIRAALGVMARFKAREIFTLGPAGIPCSFLGQIRILRKFKDIQFSYKAHSFQQIDRLHGRVRLRPDRISRLLATRLTPLRGEILYSLLKIGYNPQSGEYPEKY